jgi:hypothetical protein
LLGALVEGLLLGRADAVQANFELRLGDWGVAARGERVVIAH